MLPRRKVLKLLGLGTASAPLAAKVIAEQEAAQLTSLRGAGATVMGHGAALRGAPAQTGSSYIAGISSYVRLFGVPEHVDRRLREQCREVHSLDPDLACKRSWSLSVKMQEQRRRNYERQVDYYRHRDRWQNAQEKFKAVTGLDWYW